MAKVRHGAPRVYLAGPEVFLPEARTIGLEKARICAEAGLEGVFPLDQSLDLEGKSKLAAATMIQEADEAMMRSCNLCIANLTPFRGVSMDSGTAYEVGFMRALGRPVLGYTNIADDYAARAHAWRVTRERAVGGAAGSSVRPDADRPDLVVEDFGLVENLMIAIAIRASGSDVVVHRVEAGRELIDLAAFSRCVAEARRVLGLLA